MLTATLTRNPHNPRAACLEIVGPDTFVGRRIAVGRNFAGTFAPDSKVRAALMVLARKEGRLALGDKCPDIQWV